MKPVPYTKAELMAIRALFDGKANEGQQTTAMAWIMFKVCKINQLEFHGEKTHETAFSQGERNVGMNIAFLRTPEALKAIEPAPKKPNPKPVREAKI